jgi:hypothetical protein
MRCVLYDITKACDSNSQTEITPLQNILCGLEYIISISLSISEMRYSTLNFGRPLRPEPMVCRDLYRQQIRTFKV